ncbi:MAG TPA: hypothetical protein VIN38_05525 [Thiobacillus sp.]
MVDRSEFLIHARRLHNALRYAIENMDVAPDKLAIERPLFEHYASGIYLAGSFAFLEGKYGKQPWLPTPPRQVPFDQFLQQLPPKVENTFAVAGISQKGVRALVCIRNAVTHNDSDLAKNDDKSCIAKVTDANLPGVTINGSVVTLSSTASTDFMEYVRKSLIAISMFHGDS